MIGCVPKTTSRWGPRNWTLSQPWKSKQVRSILFRDNLGTRRTSYRKRAGQQPRILTGFVRCPAAAEKRCINLIMKERCKAVAQQHSRRNMPQTKHDTNRHLAAGGRPEMSLSKGDLSLLAADWNNLLGPINAQCIRYAASLSNTTKRRRFMPIYFSLIVYFLHQ